MIGSTDYIEDYIKEVAKENEENDNIKYNLSETDIQDIADRLFDNDYLWEIINEIVNYELAKYEKEEK